MSILKILHIVGAVATVGTGLLAAINPKGIEGFTGLTAPGARGITEFRSVFGGAFIGLGLAVLLIGTRDAYRTLGVMYIAIAVVRTASMLYDKSAGVQSNIISLVIEVVFGVIMVLWAITVVGLLLGLFAQLVKVFSEHSDTYQPWAA